MPRLTKQDLDEVAGEIQSTWSQERPRPSGEDVTKDEIIALATLSDAQMDSAETATLQAAAAGKVRGWAGRNRKMVRQLFAAVQNKRHGRL